MNFLQSLLVINILLQIFLFWRSFNNLRHRKDGQPTHLVPLLYPLGAFVWEDMFVFSIFWTVSSIILLFLNSWNLTIILILLFFIFRWIGETIYWFFQQFHPSKPRPFDLGFKNLSDDSIFIIYQVACMSQAVLALFTLYLVLTRL